MRLSADLSMQVLSVIFSVATPGCEEERDNCSRVLSDLSVPDLHIREAMVTHQMFLTDKCRAVFCSSLTHRLHLRPPSPSESETGTETDWDRDRENKTLMCGFPPSLLLAYSLVGR
jgi:hypothetical protein